MAKKRANGEGNIRKRKDGRWEGRYTAGYDSKTGKRLIKNVLGKTQAEVKEKLKIALEETNGLDVSKAADVYTVASWLRTWYELYAKPNVRTATANRYELIIETYTIPRIGNIKLKMLTTRHLQKLYKELLESGRIHVGKNQDKGLSSTTVHSVHLMLHCALDRAVKERLISRNPCEDCIVPKPRKLEMKILPPEHMKAYLEAAEARGLLPMFYLELISGLRKGELVALRWDDLDIQQRTISVSKQYVRNPDGSLELTRPKTENSVRLVSIPQTAVDLLIQEHSKHPDSPYMFPSPLTGEMYHPDSVVNLHKKILMDAGLEHLRFHDLRHTFATTALQNGVDVKTVSSMLGHLHPRYQAKTGRSRCRYGQLHGASSIKTKRKMRRTGSLSPVRHSCVHCFRCLISACGSRCGSEIWCYTAKQFFATKKSPKTAVFRDFWSCYPDLNWGPHPYQKPLLLFVAFRIVCKAL